MIEPAILAAIRTRLDGSLLKSAGRRRPFVAAGVALGFVDDARAARLAAFGPRVFDVNPARVELGAGLRDEASRTAAIADVADALRAEGALPGWRDERYRVAPAFDAAVVFHLERGAARYFGVRTFAAHVNGLVRAAPGPSMWLARRSLAKATDPGMLDNLVGGGIAAGFSVAETVVKESWEEAGIPATLAATAAPRGLVHVVRDLADGLQRETIFVHDLDLPAHFVPANQDGEAAEHRRVGLADAARVIAADEGHDAMTVDASLVVLDCLIRHDVIAPDAPEFAALAALRHCGAAVNAGG